MSKEKTIGQICFKKRNSGETFAFCQSAYPGLVKGGTIGIKGGDISYVEMIKRIFRDSFKIEVEHEEIKDIRPKNNMRPIYNRWDEIIGIDFIPTTEVVIGYKIKIKNE